MEAECKPPGWAPETTSPGFVELPDASDEVEAAELESAGIPPDAERLLVKTPNSGTGGRRWRSRPAFVRLPD